MHITKGITGLLNSRKGVLSLLLLTCITSLCALGKLDGTAYAAVCSVIASVFCWSQSSTDKAAINNPNIPTPYPPPQ